MSPGISTAVETNRRFAAEVPAARAEGVATALNAVAASSAPTRARMDMERPPCRCCTGYDARGPCLSRGPRELVAAAEALGGGGQLGERLQVDLGERRE